MNTTTSILGTDIISLSRTTINSNFAQISKNIIVYKSSIQSNNTSVMVADTELRMNIGANEVWTAEFNVQVAGGAAPDMNIQVLTPSVVGGGFMVNGRTANSAAGQAMDGFDAPTAIIATTSGSNNYFTIKANIRNGSNVGSVVFGWRQNVNTTSSTISILPGSNLIAYRLA